MAPFQEAAERPSAPQVCLRHSSLDHDVTLDLKVVDGHVRDFEVVEDVLSSAPIHVDQAVRACLLDRFASWSWAVPRCPAHESVSFIPVILHPSIDGSGGVTNAVSRPESEDEAPPCAPPKREDARTVFETKPDRRAGQTPQGTQR
jgi:hypothetical protein